MKKVAIALAFLVLPSISWAVTITDGLVGLSPRTDLIMNLVGENFTFEKTVLDSGLGARPTAVRTGAQDVPISLNANLSGLFNPRTTSATVNGSSTPVTGGNLSLNGLADIPLNSEFEVPGSTQPHITAVFPFTLTGNLQTQNAGLLPLDGAGRATGIFAQSTIGSSLYDLRVLSFAFEPPGAVIPEPSTVLLLGSGLIGLFLWRQRHAQ